MPQKDYVKAGRAAPRPRKNTKTVKPSPWPLVITVSVLVLGFIWFLYHLSQKTPVADPVTPVISSKKDDLPPKPAKEPYQYIEELENKEIQVTVEELEAKGPFLMFCGTYRANETAQQMKAKVAFAGYPSEVRRIEGKNGVFFRVTLGPYSSKRQAESDRSRLLRQKVADCRIATL
ncbi:MAG: SPOR domain-containing protein [Gammaproteobacteria bacterium]|nr:SPOR domain-containing protein [Gammaproteobacteria bacterium]MBU2056539.1 SPOR domain-containing protein [Gammaproteobacteria bacterium]MBU2174198.1 SPOR domain-containing protein [Gammaproteobacteria bacterium]MBU2248751.1 SPOR domain-containing protein [Gammaproteobacteria bacterium]MBU2346497.1 SPOR domain-containing protein [Gammaproteobacteria bacterium]